MSHEDIEYCAHGEPIADGTDVGWECLKCATARRVVATPASKMKMKVARWLYDRRIPSHAITLLAGREGIGKSTVCADIIAKYTRGTLSGYYLGNPRGVGIVATEDAWAEVIVPRLFAAGADLNKVFQLEAIEDNAVSGISTPGDLKRLKETCKSEDIGLIVLDPMMSIIEGNIDTHKDREVRKALDPLAAFCAKNTVAVLGLIHANKSITNDPLNSIMGSRAFTAVCRSVLYCIQDPEEERQFLFGHPKSNLGPNQPSIAYTIAEHRIPLDDYDDPRESEIVTSKVVWGEVDQRSIADALGDSKNPRSPGELAKSLEKWINAKCRTVAASEIHDSPDFQYVKRTTLDSTLSRMVKRGSIARPSNGYYAPTQKAG